MKAKGPKHKKIISLKSYLLHSILNYTGKKQTIADFDRIKCKKLFRVQKYYRKFDKLIALKDLKYFKYMPEIRNKVEAVYNGFSSSLKLEYSLLPREILLDIVKINSLTNLKELVLNLHPVMPEILTSLMSSKLLSSVQVLNLYGNGQVETQLDAIKGLCQNTTNLFENINLRSMRIKDEHLRFFKNTHFPELRRLDLSGNLISDKGLEFFDQAQFPKLKILDLSSNRITNMGEDLLRTAKLPKLEALENFKGFNR